MKNVLQNVEPKEVFRYFEEISKIPRGSGNEKEISDFLVQFAKKRNLEVDQDEALNVVIKKNASKGYEKSPTVILQGHMDMVCEKNKDTVHDFKKDPIKIEVDEDFIRAKGTTLGADNGIAVAFCLAILDNDHIKHPKVEVLFTTEEEMGLKGAANLEPSNLNGKILINIDSEEEGVLFVSCSGGIRSKVEIPIVWKDYDEGCIPYKLQIRGLKGGHSGMDIDKGRGNANKLIGRVLQDLFEHDDIYVSDIHGGDKLNAIPREVDATILFKNEYIEKIQSKIKKWDDVFKHEFQSSDPHVSVKIEKIDRKIEKVFSDQTLEKVLALSFLIPCGVQKMSMDIEGLVESSTNLGVISTTKEKIVFSSATRSSVRTMKDYIAKQIKEASKLVEAEFSTEASYPEWAYKKDSYIRELFIDVYKRLYGKEPEIAAVHAGLECGLFSEKLGDMDMISFGPNMYDVHTPNEHLSRSSTERTWKYLLSVLEEIK
ncbi:aminoacyl-histidine dipeptidase [Crassaminicella profunda]|uniref:aminoacyl-histidine dipeptidase n=1 Tax=Crassaminicella profunda TaxID=1286698 RepID=UPI001CA6AFA9|nr:aminoacyl-histidine dipeptidase [Crassaminicella profunda]QZY54442.1 aminoacyl-histidine dipeptidase [Crassaminicella profunda]